MANFVETEQILTINDTEGPLAGAAASYVVVRGSIPLLWTQLPNLKYKPTTVIAPTDMNAPVRGEVWGAWERDHMKGGAWEECRRVEGHHEAGGGICEPLNRICAPTGVSTRARVGISAEGQEWA